MSVRAAVRRCEVRELQPTHREVAPRQLRVDEHERGPSPLAAADALCLVDPVLAAELQAGGLKAELQAA